MLETAPPCGAFGVADLGQWHPLLGFLPMGQHSGLILTLVLLLFPECSVKNQGTYPGLVSAVGHQRSWWVCTPNTEMT